MADYEKMRRRWVSAFSANALFGGVGLTADPSRHSSRTRGLDWSVSRVPSRAVRASVAGRPAAVPGLSTSATVPSEKPGIERRLVIDEAMFRGVLIREQKRADRFGEPFVVLLVGQDPASCDGAILSDHTVRTVIAATRETDVIGWVTRGRVLGVVLTEIGESDEGIARDIEARIRHEVGVHGRGNAVSDVSVRLHFNVRSKETAAEGLWPA